MAGIGAKSKNEPKEATKKDIAEKQSGEAELGSGVSSMLRGIADATFNCLAAGYEGFMSGVSKLSEKLGSNDPKVVDIRKKLRAHHIGQAKESLHNVKNGALKFGNGVRHTAVGGIRTILESGKDTIKGLREKKNNIVEMPDETQPIKKAA